MGLGEMGEHQGKGERKGRGGKGREVWAVRIWKRASR